MKNLILILILFAIFIFSSCQKNDLNYVGKITEQDFSKCVCCGGFLLKIDNNQYNIFEQNLPSNNLDLKNAKLPMKVSLNFTIPTSGCENFIEVQKIRKR